MDDKVGEIIQVIRQAAEFLLKHREGNRSERYLYLLTDIRSGIFAVNNALLKKYGTSAPFDISKFEKEMEGSAEPDSLPDELSRWMETVAAIRSRNLQETTPALLSGPIDRNFSALAASVGGKSQDELNRTIRENLHRLKKDQKINYTATLEYYNKYKLWGMIQPERGVYDLVDNRARALCEHFSDFEWLYRRLCDNRSKKILTAILTYWFTFDWKKIDGIVDHTFPQYFDLDLVNCGRDEVFVDVGAYIGDTLADYINVFGRDCYRKFYCYEILPSNVKKIRRLVDKYTLENVEIRFKGISGKAGEMFTKDVEMSSVGRLSEDGEVKVPIVSVDEDIEGPVTFIKMDIEGAEEDALNGCLKKIGQYHPKLALSAYHNHKDLWKLARMIDGVDSTYHFYLRYYGGNLCPTEYLLYAI